MKPVERSTGFFYAKVSVGAIHESPANASAIEQSVFSGKARLLLSLQTSAHMDVTIPQRKSLAIDFGWLCREIATAFGLAMTEDHYRSAPM